MALRNISFLFAVLLFSAPAAAWHGDKPMMRRYTAPSKLKQCELWNETRLPAASVFQKAIGGPKLIKTYKDGDKVKACESERHRRGINDYRCHCV